ncbi:MAG: DUF134 domain-containing protein [bacterium]
MPRPHIVREVSGNPVVKVFKPLGVPVSELDHVELTLDELEALRLAHLKGFYQVAISRRMGVSRQTVGRILESAHHKVTQAIVEGMTLSIGGGTYRESDLDPYLCRRCGRHHARHGRHGRGSVCPEDDE